MGKRTRRVCGGFPAEKNRFLTGAALLVAVDGNPTGSFVRCDIADPVERMVCEGRHPGTCVPGSCA